MRAKKATEWSGGGKRRLNVDTGPDRTALIRRQQIAANALVYCYYGACFLSVLGLFEAIRRFRDTDTSQDTATGLITGLAVLIASGLWALFTAYSAYGLKQVIEKRNVHAIRRRSLAAFLLALAGMVTLIWTSGTAVLASASLGLVAAGLILLSIVSLTAYAANRFIDA